MRKMIRLAIFFLTLLLGFQAVAVMSGAISMFSIPAEVTVVDDESMFPSARSPTSVRIMYDGTHSVGSDHPPVLRFIIFNGTSEPITCLGYEGGCVSPEILVNEKDGKAWVCLNGSSRYTIEPGRSAYLSVMAYDLNILPGKAEKVAIGYEFNNYEGRPEQYFAEPITLPAEFREAVRKDIADRGSY